MALHTKSAEETQCSFLDNPEHAVQRHISLSSLPSPDTPVVIESCPIEIRSETSVFKPKKIAALWTQLLSIQIQNGNFWKHENAVALHKEKAPPVPSREDSKAAEDTKMEKMFLYLRHKIQRGLLSRDTEPTEEELPKISEFFTKLESLGDPSPNALRCSKIHKVCRVITKLESVPGDNVYNFKSRAATLNEKYRKILEQAAQENQTSNQVPLNDNQPTQTALEPQGEPTGVEIDGPPAICLTQMTPEQCAIIEEAAQACSPPLDRGVVELMCLIPQFTSKYGTHDLQPIPMGRLVQPLDKFPKLERGVYRRGPTIPPHMLQLTTWLSPNYGTALFVDTKTGEGLELKEFEPYERDILCTKFEGSRRPIEELLQELIDHFLYLKLVPSGGEDIMSDKFRSMDYLKQKFLLEEYNWPTAFPLPPSQYASLTRRQAALLKERIDRWEIQPGLNLQWSRLTYEWYQANGYPNGSGEELEKFKTLDRQIEEALLRHIRKAEDREYALAADVPLDPKYHGPLVLYPSTNIGNGWRVGITPAMILERFHEVADPSLGANPNTDVAKMKEILDAAFERWKLSEQGIHSRDEVDEVDDDPTSDYEQSEYECSEEEEFETDEEEEDMDFDLVLLKADMEKDIEDIRKALEGYEIEEDDFTTI